MKDLNWWMLFFHCIFLQYAQEITLLWKELPLEIGALMSFNSVQQILDTLVRHYNVNFKK